MKRNVILHTLYGTRVKGVSCTGVLFENSGNEALDALFEWFKLKDKGSPLIFDNIIVPQSLSVTLNVESNILSYLDVHLKVCAGVEEKPLSPRAVEAPCHYIIFSFAPAEVEDSFINILLQLDVDDTEREITIYDLNQQDFYCPAVPDDYKEKELMERWNALEEIYKEIWIHYTVNKYPKLKPLLEVGIC